MRTGRHAYARLVTVTVVVMSVCAGLAVVLTARPSPAATSMSGTATSQSRTVRRSHALSVDVDAFVRSDHPRQSFSHRPWLQVGAHPTARSYLRFNLAAVSGTIVSARLVLHCGTPSRGLGIHRVQWSGPGASLTYRRSPDPQGLVAHTNACRRGGAVAVDVSRAVRVGVEDSFVLTSPARRGQLISSGDTNRGPVLHVVTATTVVPPARSLTFPVRAAFYYPWYPQAWVQQGYDPFTAYHPTRGQYSSSSATTISDQIADMQYAHLDAGIASWWGQGSSTDQRVTALLDGAHGTGFKWALYYEPEGQGDPTSGQIASDLAYIKTHYTSDPSYLYVQGRPVIFVYTSGPDNSCGLVNRWAAGNASQQFFVVLKVFTGFRDCATQPSSWHQYAPAVHASQQLPYASVVSPGFNKLGDPAPRLDRDLVRFQNDVTAMVASQANWQLVTTYNEWGEGTAVESADEWSSDSGHGSYIDVLHDTLPVRGPDSPPPPPPPPGGDPVVMAAGDIACSASDANFNGGAGGTSSCREMAVSGLALGAVVDAVLPLGDLQYDCGETADWQASYDKSWGRLLSVSHPAIGNHEYGRACGRNDATPYFDYFGARAGADQHGWYSYDLGTWHLIALNSECKYGTGAGQVGGCGPGSPQMTWLQNDLATHPTQCTLAYWHEPRFSSGEHGDAQQMTDIWNVLVQAKADIVLSGHNHDYERFDPAGVTPVDPNADPAGSTTGTPSFQDPVLDPTGIRSWVVGTGGKNHYGFTAPALQGEVVRNSDTFGALKLTLHDGSYDWEFVPEPGKTFTDSGTGLCH